MYIDPFFSRDTIPCINPFYHKVTDPVTIDLLCQQFTAAFLDLMGSAGLSLYMDTLLKPCLFLLFSEGNCGLSDLQQMMDDTANEKRINLGKQSSHPMYRSFFENFSHKRYEATKLALYTRIQNLLNHRAVYEMLNGVPTVDFARAMDQGMVVLVNLSKGKL